MEIISLKLVKIELQDTTTIFNLITKAYKLLFSPLANVMPNVLNNVIQAKKTILNSYISTCFTGRDYTLFRIGDHFFRVIQDRAAEALRPSNPSPGSFVGRHNRGLYRPNSFVPAGAVPDAAAGLGGQRQESVVQRDDRCLCQDAKIRGS